MYGSDPGVRVDILMPQEEPMRYVEKERTARVLGLLIEIRKTLPHPSRKRGLDLRCVWETLDFRPV